MKMTSLHKKRTPEMKHMYSPQFREDLSTAIQYLQSPEAPQGPFQITELYDALDLGDNKDFTYQGDLVKVLLEQNHLYQAGPSMPTGFRTAASHRRNRDGNQGPIWEQQTK